MSTTSEISPSPAPIQLKVPKGTRDLDPFQMAVRSDVLTKLTSVFEIHGAETIDTPVFELKEVLMGKYGEDSKLIYDLADQGGELLSLRYDLTVPFSRYMAMNGLKKMKRYHIGKVYRRDNPAMTRGRFREFTQCDFDVAGPSEGMLTDAEVLRVLHDCLESLELGVEYTIKLNHRGILDGILQVSGVAAEQVRHVSSSIDKLDKAPWEDVREELIQKGLSTHSVRQIGEYVLIKGSPRDVLAKLAGDSVLVTDARAKKSIEDMGQLIEILDLLGVLHRISFDLGLARGLDYYTGIIFEAVMNLPSEDSGETRVGSIAAGGRYDALINMFGGPQVPAVGMSVGIERIFSLVEEKYRRQAELRSTRTKALVVIAGDSVEVQRMRIRVCSELWTARIPCELLPVVHGKLKPQLNYANERRIPFVLIVGEDEVAKGGVTLRDMDTKAQVFLPLTSLARSFKDATFPPL